MIEKLKDGWERAPLDKKWRLIYKKPLPDIKTEIWYVFPFPRYGSDKDPVGQEYYILSDLISEIIYSKHTYEGRQCKRGWAVGAYYIQFDNEDQAIELHKELNQRV